MNPDDLPDLPHLLRVPERLWEDRETGRAAVLVGSGFSRNAEPVDSSAPQYPLRKDVARAIYDELHSIGPNPSEEKRKEWEIAISGDTLSLAFEYKAAFGREALDELLFDLQRGRAARRIRISLDCCWWERERMGGSLESSSEGLDRACFLRSPDSPEEVGSVHQSSSHFQEIPVVP